MGIQFKPSAPRREDIEGSDPVPYDKIKRNQFESTKFNSSEKEFQTIDLNALPEQVESTYDGSFAEFVPQLIGILPGESFFH